MAGEPILVVEDNPITRKMICFALAAERYDVLEAGDGKTALELASRRPPALIVQDYVLPDMDGLRLVEGLRALPGLADVPILMVTGMVSQLEALSAAAGQHTTILPKPLEPSRLVEIVGTYLRAGLSAGAHALGRGRRVLVVDDKAMNRQLVARWLRKAGFEVDTAEGGEEALAKARRSVPDAILSDVLMIGMDGFVLCKTVRADPKLKRVPVVLLSAFYVQEPDRELARAMGAHALVLRSPDLQSAVSALLEALENDEPPVMAMSTDALDALHKQRVKVQLEAQLARNEALLRQEAIQAAALSVVRALATVLAKPEDLAGVLGDVLVHCLDATGLSTGLLYLPGADGSLQLKAQAGLPSNARADAAACFGTPDLLRRTLDAGDPVGCCTAVPGQPPELRELAERLGRAFVLLIPFVVAEERIGLLVLASDSQNLSEPAWTGFARALAAQFGQTIAVGRSLQRGAASEVRYRTLMENANDAILLMEPGRHILEANRQAELLLGRPREDIVGHKYVEFVVPAERAEAEAKSELLRDGSERVQNRQMQRADGSTVFVDVSASLVRIGEEALSFAILRDVTERNRAEAALRESEERTRRIVFANPSMIYALRVEPDGRLTPTWVSENVERLLGYSTQEASRYEWWASNVHPEDRERVLEHIRSMLSETDQWAHEYRFRHKDGNYRWLRDEQRLLRDAGGAREIVGSWSDVTDRKDAELLLAESEEQYRLLFDSNPHPMWVYDDETLEFLAVNEAAVRSYGYTLDEFLNMTIRDIHPPEEIPAFEERLAQTDETRGPGLRMRTWTHRKKDGGLIQAEVTSTRITFAGRKACLTLVNDVTEKKVLEAQLIQAQKMESVGRLAGGVAHDFNNLLGVITGYGELLRRRLEEPRLKKYSEDILQAADRAAGLTRQLLAFSRRQVLQPRVLGLNGIVEEVEKMLRRLIGEDIKLTTALARDIGLVRADRGQVEQVLMNLAVNARDAMPKGGRITLETARVELDEAYTRKHEGIAPGHYVMLAVSDTGHGMTPDVRARIFEPFFTTKGEGKGTGLGLATVYGIVKQSGGHIFVYSEPGAGSTFKVYLPRIEAEAEVEAPAALLAPARGSETILLVEDEVSLRELVRECLEDCGYTVLDARHGADALVRAAGHKGPIHLVVTDVVMPGIGGRDLVERLAAQHPGLRVLYMSGYTDDAVVHHGVLSEEMDFLQKPFTQEELARKVREVLDRPAA